MDEAFHGAGPGNRATKGGQIFLHGDKATGSILAGSQNSHVLRIQLREGSMDPTTGYLKAMAANESYFGISLSKGITCGLRDPAAEIPV